MGEAISTSHGVTQGKNSSANMFSYYVSDMPDSVNENVDVSEEFMNEYDVLQLADDSVILAEDEDGFKRKALALAQYSRNKNLVINEKKTKYICAHRSSHQKTIIIDQGLKIDPVNSKLGYNWLGFWMIHSNELHELISFNINKKMFSIRKFYEWLSENEDTPFLLKIKVLYSCLFSTLIYSCEAWGDLENISVDLLKFEKRLLKRILGVKEGTTDKIVYFECNRPDVIAVIKDRQRNFFKKLSNLRSEDTSTIGVIELYDRLTQYDQHSGLLNYYRNLSENNQRKAMEDIMNSLRNSDASMCKRYVELTELQQPTCLYNSLPDDKDRTIITRWRLSCHKLYIEIGRYKRPIISRDDRKCKICNVIEDETHAMYKCSAHQFIRISYKELLSLYPSVKYIFNPKTSEHIKAIANYIRDIEDNMETLQMLH